MEMFILKLLSSYLRKAADKIDANACELSEEDMSKVLSVIAHEPLSKPQAFQFLNISRSKFDTMVKNGELPKGRKRLGFNELVWYKDELILYGNNS